MKPEKQMAIISSATTMAMYSLCKIFLRKGLITPAELIASLQADADAVMKLGTANAAAVSGIQHSLIAMIRQGTGMKPSTGAN